MIASWSRRRVLLVCLAWFVVLAGLAVYRIFSGFFMDAGEGSGAVTIFFTDADLLLLAAGVVGPPVIYGVWSRRSRRR